MLNEELNGFYLALFVIPQIVGLCAIVLPFWLLTVSAKARKKRECPPRDIRWNLTVQVVKYVIEPESTTE